MIKGFLRYEENIALRAILGVEHYAIEIMTLALAKAMNQGSPSVEDMRKLYTTPLVFLFGEFSSRADMGGYYLIYNDWINDLRGWENA